MNRYNIGFRKVDDTYYEVTTCGISVGHVYRNDEAWSGARWFIEGEKHPADRGGYSSGGPLKARGYVSRKAAAEKLAQMRSAVVVSSAIQLERAR